MVAVTEPASTATRRVARPGDEYRPHLDGLRAVAVYLVVLFHAGVARFSGGFIGVDVFFVLSGYLVTQLLMRDLDSHGTIRFSRFYARRMRRLLPASLVALLVTAVVYSAVASRAEASSAVNAFKAAFLYVANWFFIHRSSDYFATDINNNPVVHFWSLAVEEQFYFVWPLLLGGLYAVTRRFDHYAHRAMQIAVASGALISLLWALHLAAYNLNRAYYGTDTRAYQLLAGALLALSPGVIRHPATRRVAFFAAPLALLTLIVFATSRIHTNTVHRGIAATITTVVLITAIESARRGPVNRMLSSNPAVFLGKISYGTYLWHWPVIVVALAVSDKGLSPTSMFAISAMLATGLASLSYHLIERPIREQRRLDTISPIVVGTGLAIAVIAALVLIPRVLRPLRSHAGSTAPAAATAGTPIPDLDFADATKVPASLQGVHFQHSWNCKGKPASACTVVSGSGPSVLIIGDSHAQMFMPGFARMAQTQHLTLEEAASAACPWQRDVYVPEDNVGTDTLNTKSCIAMKSDLYTRVIPELKPDLIIAISSDYLTRRVGVVLGSNGRPLPAPNATALQQLEATDTAQSLKAMSTYAKKVLIVDPIPTTTPADDPFVCLTKSKFVEDCRFVASTSPSPLRLVYARLTDSRRVYTANIDKLVCPYMPICDPIVDGIIVRHDYEHLTPAYALSLAGQLTSVLQSDGLIPGG